MTERIEQLLKTRPFRPFVLETIGGTHINVDKPEWFFEPPGSGEFVVFGNGAYWICSYQDLTDNILVLPK